MAQITNNDRKCATCEYWLGDRFPHRLGFVEVASPMDSGRCALQGMNESRRYQAVYLCSRYRKWEVLK